MSDDVTIREAAELLGISTNMLRYKMRMGELNSEMKDGVHYISRAAVEELSRKYKPNPVRQGRRKMKQIGSPKSQTLITRGRMASDVFKCIALNMPFRDIVIQTKCAPEVVREFWREYHQTFEQGRHIAEIEKQERERVRFEKEQMRLEKERKSEKRMKWLEKMAELRAKRPIVVMAQTEKSDEELSRQ